MSNLKELFALPIGLHKVAMCDNIPLYGSQTLNDKFIQSINNSKRGKLVSKRVEDLVKDEVIIPCFADKGMLSYFRRKISKDTSGGLLRVVRFLIGDDTEHPLDYILAYYDYTEHKIIFLISNHLDEKYSTTASDISIAISLTHEMMHMYSHLKPNKFISLFKNELNSYYSNYFKEIFKLKDDKMVKNVIEDIYKYLFFNIESTTKTNVSLKKLFDRLVKLIPFSKLSKDEFENVLSSYLMLVRLLLTNNIKMLMSYGKKYKHLINPLYSSYKKSFGKVPVKGCIQEIIAPSEVICGCTDIKIDSKIKSALESI